MTSLTVGIGGASRSGKTTLASDLVRHFEKASSVTLFHQDDFIVPEADIPRIRDEIDWEHPASIDFPRLISAIRSAQETHILTIVEGFLLYAEPDLYRLLDMHFFMKIDEEEFFKRRRQDRRYGTDAKWYIRHTWTSFLEHGQIPPDIRDEVLVIPQDYNLRVLVEMVAHRLQTIE